MRVMKVMRDLRVLYRPAFIIIPVLLIGMLFILHTHASSLTDSVSYRSIRIEEGDTLNSIYSRYRSVIGVSRSEFIDHVVEVNDLQDADHIHYDMFLLVPCKR